MSERMSEDRLEQLRSIVHNWLDAYPTPLDSKVCGRIGVELVAEIDALRAELAEAERNWAEQEKRGTIAQTDLNIALNKLAAAERERDRAREALRLMLAHSCVADSDPTDKDEEDHAAERAARAALKGEP